MGITYGDSAEEELIVHSFYCPPESGQCADHLDLPSKRYITLLREGARHWNLDPEYCQYLDDYPCANPPKAARYAFLGFVIFPLFFPLMVTVASIKIVEKLTKSTTLTKSCQPTLIRCYYHPMKNYIW